MLYRVAKLIDWPSLSGKLCDDWEKSHFNTKEDMNRLAHTKIKSSVCLVTLVMSDSATLWTIARQAALSIGFSREEEWMLWTVVLEKTLESPLDCKEIQPVHSEGDQPWVFFGRNDAETETPVLWPPHMKSWLIGKDWGWRDWGQEEKGMTEDEMAGWHHGLDRHESEWTPGVGDGQGGLACCDSWGHKESDMAEWLNWAELMRSILEKVPYVLEKKVKFIVLGWNVL